jgi:hypothetical protein
MLITKFRWGHNFVINMNEAPAAGLAVTDCVHSSVEGSGAGQLTLQSLTVRYFTLNFDTLCDLGVPLG